VTASATASSHAADQLRAARRDLADALVVLGHGIGSELSREEVVSVLETVALTCGTMDAVVMALEAIERRHLTAHEEGLRDGR
jgi:predicted TIM-barrel enzyme